MLSRIKFFFKKYLWRIWEWIKHLFKSEYEITIYRQAESGNMYKSQYVSRNILVNKQTRLQFKDHDTGKMVDIQSAKGLEFKIVEK
jgi:hypothetical protein|tara:strand:+ start:1530 stop:1787 length:258 start_codon:yes stop_codon:yes gene_type:complete